MPSLLSPSMQWCIAGWRRGRTMVPSGASASVRARVGVPRRPAAAPLCACSSTAGPFFYSSRSLRGSWMRNSIDGSYGSFSHGNPRARSPSFHSLGGHLHLAHRFASPVPPIQSRGFRRDRTRGPDMRVCQNIEELVQMAYENLQVMSPRDIAAFWTLAAKFLGGTGSIRSIQAEEVQRLETILVHTLEKIKAFGQRDLTQTTLGLAKVAKSARNVGRGVSEGSPAQILHATFVGEDSYSTQFILDCMAEAAIHRLPEFDGRCLANLIYAYGMAGYACEFDDGSTLFDVVAPAAIAQLQSCEPQGFSNIAWAYANAEVPNTALFEAVAEHIVSIDSLESFRPQALSNTVWAYATLEESHPELFKKVADRIVTLDLRPFSEQALANIVWAYATAKESHPELFKTVADHIVTLDSLGSFKAQALSNSVWAYATAGESHPKLFQRVAEHIVSLDLQSFKPQALSNIVWAFATSKESHPKLFERVAEHIVSLDLRSFKPQHLSNTLWAFATTKESHPKLFEKVADHIISLDLESFDAQALANSLWAYATANESHPKLFEKVADHIVTLDLRPFKPQALANTLWAYATAKESHPELFKRVSDAAIQRKYEFIEPQHIANLLWAFAANGQIDSRLFQSFAQTAAELTGKGNEQNLANLAWAYAVANVDAPALFSDAFTSACVKNEGEFAIEALRQLHQWNLWQEELQSNIRLPPSLQKKCYEAFVSAATTPSALQDDVISELLSIGLHPEEEHLTARGYSLDALVEVNGSKVGVEVDGPSHFLGRQPTGKTLLKRRQVAALEGIPIVSVPYWEWQKLGKNREKKQGYLRALVGL